MHVQSCLDCYSQVAHIVLAPAGGMVAIHTLSVCVCALAHSVLLQVGWICWQYTLSHEARIILGHMPIPEYKSFLVDLKVRRYSV